MGYSRGSIRQGKLPFPQPPSPRGKGAFHPTYYDRDRGPLIFAIGMAADAVANVANAMLQVFCNHLLLVMAAKAGVAWGWAGVAGAALTVGPAVIQGEGVVERGPIPRLRAVAGRTLPREVVGRRRVTALAVG